MPRSVFHTLVLFVFILSFVAGLKANTLHADDRREPRGEPEGYIEVEDTFTTVLAVAKVHLSIGRLTVNSGHVYGGYALEVPMRTAKSEAGVLSLTSERTLSELRKDGGRLTGEGRNLELPESRRSIVCDILPDPDVPDTGTIYLVIDTGERVLKFESVYRLVAP